MPTGFSFCFGLQIFTGRSVDIAHEGSANSTVSFLRDKRTRSVTPMSGNTKARGVENSHASSVNLASSGPNQFVIQHLRLNPMVVHGIRQEISIFNVNLALDTPECSEESGSGALDTEITVAGPSRPRAFSLNAQG